MKELVQIGYVIESEWDLGEQNLCFKNKEKAIEWLKSIWLDELGTLESALEDNLIQFIPMYGIQDD